MTDNLILFGYGSAMFLGFAAVATVVYYSLSRNFRYQKRVNVRNLVIENAEQVVEECSAN